MSRFSNLEFEGEEKKEKKRKETSHFLDQQKDEGYYLTEGDSHYRLGRFEKALRAYSRALELNPALQEAWLGQVKMLLELEEPKEADIWAEKALGKFPDHSELIGARAVAQARMGNIEKAMAFSDSSIRKKESSSFLWLARGEVFLVAGHKNYEYCFQKAYLDGPSPKDWWIPFSVGRIYKYYRKFSRALKELQAALAMESASPFIWYEVGLCQIALGLKQNALFSLRQVLELDPSYLEAREAISQAESTSLWERIVGYFKKLWEK